jgi:hypothetical protein
MSADELDDELNTILAECMPPSSSASETTSCAGDTASPTSVPPSPASAAASPTIDLAKVEGFLAAARDKEQKKDAPPAAEAETAELRMLQAAVADGVGTRDTMGIRFSRSHHAKSEEYTALSSRAEKAEFRRRWAEQQLQQYRARNTKTETYEEVSETDGCYIPLAVLYWEEGQRGVDRNQDLAAVRAGTRYAQMCFRLGGKFLRWNEWTARWEYLHLKHHARDKFTKAWSKFVEERTEWQDRSATPIGDGTNTNGRKGEGKAVGGTTTMVPKDDEAKDSTITSGKGSGNTTGIAGNIGIGFNKGKNGTDDKLGKLDSGTSKGTGIGKASEQGMPPAPKKQKTKTTLDEAWNAAVKIRGAYINATATSSAVLNAMKDDQMWAWADTQTKVGLQSKLKAAASDLERSCTPFTRRFLTTDGKQLRKEIVAANLEAELLKFAELEPLIKQVDLEAKVLTAMGNTRCVELMRASAPSPAVKPSGRSKAARRRA